MLTESELMRMTKEQLIGICLDLQAEVKTYLEVIRSDDLSGRAEVAEQSYKEGRRDERWSH